MPYAVEYAMAFNFYLPSAAFFEVPFFFFFFSFHPPTERRGGSAVGTWGVRSPVLGVRLSVVCVSKVSAVA